jgi:integrase
MSDFILPVTASIYPAKDANYKDKNGNDVDKWFIRYTLKFQDSPPPYYKDNSLTQYRREFGKSYNLSLTGFNKKRDKEYQAELLLARVQDDLDKGIDPEYREYALLKLKQKNAIEAQAYHYDRLVELFMIENMYINPIPKKEISARAYKSFFNNQLRNFLDSINKLDDIRLITTEDVETYLERGRLGQFSIPGFSKASGEHRTNKPWNSTTTNIKRGWISALFSIAIRKRLILINPVAIISKRKVEPRKEARFKIYSRREVEIIWNYMESNNLMLDAICKILYYAYIRRSEIFRIRLKMIDLDKNVLTIAPEVAKGQRDGYSRQVKIYPQLAKSLKQWIDYRFQGNNDGEYFLFPNKKDALIAFKYASFHRMFNSELLTIQTINKGHFKIKSEFYALKHTSVTFFIEDNFNTSNSLKVLTHLMKQLRHEDFSTTQKYISKDLGLNIDAEDEFVML